MGLEFATPHPVLEKPPLRLVICQLRFPHQLGLSQADLKPIQRAIAEEYPRAEVGKVAEFNLGPEGATPSPGLESVFHFRSDDAGWTATVTQSSISLETKAYEGFPDFLDRWRRFCSAAAEALGIERQERIGLRYVNELECAANASRSDLGALIREELIGSVGAHERTEILLNSMHEMRFAQRRGVCTLRHGLRPKEGENVYVLDFDFYEDTAEHLDLEAQTELLAEFNGGAFEIFRWAVTEELFESFEPKERVDA